MKIKTLIAVLLLSCSFCNYKDVEVVFASQEVSQDEMVNNLLYAKYTEEIDRESAYEILKKLMGETYASND